MDTVYVETTIIGHFAGRIHADPSIAAHQASTRRWWATAVTRYRFFISQLVLDECAAGDPVAAQERLDEIEELPLPAITDQVRELAIELTNKGAIPSSEPRDALHIAVATVHGIEYLLTWNFRHIANAAQRGQIESVCRDAGFGPPVICTPEELAGDEHNVDVAD